MTCSVKVTYKEWGWIKTQGQKQNKPQKQNEIHPTGDKSKWKTEGAQLVLFGTEPVEVKY